MVYAKLLSFLLILLAFWLSQQHHKPCNIHLKSGSITCQLQNQLSCHNFHRQFSDSGFCIRIKVFANTIFNHPLRTMFIKTVRIVICQLVLNMNSQCLNKDISNICCQAKHTLQTLQSIAVLEVQTNVHEHCLMLLTGYFGLLHEADVKLLSKSTHLPWHQQHTIFISLCCFNQCRASL